MRVGGKYGLDKDAVPDALKKKNKGVTAKKEVPAAEEQAAGVVSVGPTVTAPVFNQHTGQVVMTPMPWPPVINEGIQGPALAQQTYHQPVGQFTKPPRSQPWQSGGRGQQMKKKPTYSYAASAVSTAAVLMAGRGPGRYGPKGPPTYGNQNQSGYENQNQAGYGNRNQSGFNNSLEANNACFACGEIGHWKNHCVKHLASVAEDVNLRLERAKEELRRKEAERAGSGGALSTDQIRFTVPATTAEYPSAGSHEPHQEN